MNGLDKKVIACILCTVLLCACFGAQEGKKHISGVMTSTAISGCTTGVADTTDKGEAVSFAVASVEEKKKKEKNDHRYEWKGEGTKNR